MSQFRQRKTGSANAREPELKKSQLKQAVFIVLAIALMTAVVFVSTGVSAEQKGAEVVLIVPDETKSTIALPHRTVSAATGAPVAIERQTLEKMADFALQADPAQLAVCTPDDAVYSVQVQSLSGFTDTVTLSLSGEPISTTVEFSPNDTEAPYTSTMTISDTGSANVGSYDMEISGVSVTATHTTTVALDLNSVPGTVVLSSPSNGADDVPIIPLFVWSAASQGISYTIEVGDDPVFNNIVYSATVTDTTHMAESYLEEQTTYYWHVTPANDCGSGNASAVFSFTTRDVPPVLLVDDDDNLPDVQVTYTAALDALLGSSGYDIWDTENSDDEPDAATLSYYDSVIWFTGADYDPPAGPGNAGEAALATWLDSRGCLFLSSTDYHYAKGQTPFMEDYLGVEDVIDDQGQETAVGQNAVFAGLGPYALVYPFTDYSDEIYPDSTAEVAFTGMNGNGDGRNSAITKQGSTYVAAYLGFPWEAIEAAADREDVLTTFFDWCENGAEPSIDSTPVSLNESMMVNDVVTTTLTISNTGTGNLVWNIVEAASGDCGSPGAIDWVSLPEASGFAAAGDSTDVEVTFDADDLDGGDYSGALCINSNDASTPTVTVPLSMSVEWYDQFLSLLSRT
jgi:hypothetical protein